VYLNVGLISTSIIHSSKKITHQKIICNVSLCNRNILNKKKWSEL
jgi:hypothetical protein